MNTNNHFDQYLYEAFEYHVKEEVRINKLLSDLIKIFSGIAIGVTILVTMFGNAPDNHRTFSRLLSDYQIMVFTYLILLASYFFIKHKYRKKLSIEYENIKKELIKKGFKGIEIHNVASEMYARECRSKGLDPSTF